jgi:hypothetical protein
LTIGIVAYKFELAGAFADALAAADLAISFAPPGENWIQGNRAHALMFLGHVDEARTIYLQHRGERIEDRPWEGLPAVVISHAYDFTLNYRKPLCQALFRALQS